MHQHERAGATGYQGPETHGASQRLRLAFAVTSVVLVAELLGGIFANSLALLSDAAHVFTDILSLGLAWFAAVQAQRPPTPRRTFGFHRAGILAALVNSATLVVAALVITWEAIRRLQAPQPVDSVLMFSVAVLGLVANLYVALELHRQPGENLNVRSALLHVIGDALASAAVIVGGIIIFFTGLYFVDPLLSVLIALIIVGGAWSVVLEAINVLMEGTPTGINLEKLIDDIRAIRGVTEVHDVHVWSLAAGIHAMSGHVVVDDQAVSETAALLERISQLLSDRYGIGHVTVQFECGACVLACPISID